MWRVSPMHTSDLDRIHLSGSGSRVLKIKNCKKITAEKMLIFLDQKLPFINPVPP
jgi:hypothetical protein